ncbi:MULTISPECIES: transcriptional regulator [spotted fever group]|uniref:Transcriptional regulator n=2 Tax=Rickettsia rickettsii TaxID=783 RepID=B0BVJ3_RICRO|nr:MULTISPECIES: transcriptional regulator [spotted fever group]ABV76876.1 Predicted transcriptional regulator [Rickettsia rickettsii str. 'Sheila Smith']ABY73253.1 hypothetical protein RrIowa_1534 [Rickettsia rickettsii str. Iowa]AFB22896.1 hypothetical protein RPN_07225 [Rickettsia rickettsii str. Brazil]AFB24215.1 hypothetical protein RPL_07220 [Rickettsia rickettsii str. Colombia]AFB25558.1 hypothetical protein RPO_07225 [Rickettsia rickettsii str. Arizona]
MAVLKEAIIARGGIAKISKEAHINREHIYREYYLLNALGLQLKVEACAF